MKGATGPPHVRSPLRQEPMETEFLEAALQQHRKEAMSQTESLSISPRDPRFTDGRTIEPSLLALLLLSASAAPEQGNRALSRYRVQRGVYLLQEEGPPHWQALHFGTTDWGPYSKELDQKLSNLVSGGLLETVSDPAPNHLRLTPKGEQQASNHLLLLPDRERALVRAARILALNAFARA